MSNVLGRTASRDEARTLPTGETIGRYNSYLDAQKAVDYLADSKFPVQQVSIIGNDLKTVERVTGRLSYPRVALASAATGAWFGLFVGFILTLFGGDSTYLPIISSIALGAVFWLLFGVIAYAFQRGKRDFTSTSQVVATSYDVLVDPAAANEARKLLQQLPMNGQPRSSGPVTPSWGGPNTPSQPPQRPQGWDSPQANPVQAPASAGEPPAGDTQLPGHAAGEPDAPKPAPRGQFPDLPDGRPQYGVRVPKADPAEGPTGSGSHSVSAAAPEQAGANASEDQSQPNR